MKIDFPFAKDLIMESMSVSRGTNLQMDGTQCHYWLRDKANFDQTWTSIFINLLIISGQLM